jgi:hypothetical protein
MDACAAHLPGSAHAARRRAIASRSTTPHLPAVQSVIRNGLRKDESLVIGYRDGQGFIGVGEATNAIAAPADVARAYLEFNFVGGLLARQLARLPQRLAPTAGAATDRR